MTATFPPPVRVDPANRPASPVRGGGRHSLEPAYRAWLEALQPGAEWEFVPPPEADGTQGTDNPVSRLNSLRKVAKEMNGEADATRVYKIEAVPTVKDKRYRIFGSVAPKA
jgi:hypothetical protein